MSTFESVVVIDGMLSVNKSRRSKKISSSGRTKDKRHHIIDLIGV